MQMSAGGSLGRCQKGHLMRPQVSIEFTLAICDQKVRPILILTQARSRLLYAECRGARGGAQPRGA